ncbi:MAG: putative manganese-dependent inorganic diphosphatase [Clostridia bacterium]|nr:putative manganese-dependent inorganic diphosphatase [Clostridia bacterium]MBR0408552.1 putative manganese-dependent inorganic diphosphatase [Clostridia bacterium]
MQPITYVCGHRNPDTDSIVSAMAYASLCNAIGENDYVPARLGPPNDETNYLLNRFGFQPPMLLSTVRTQVRDIEFDRPPRLSVSVPVSHAWEILQENPNLSTLPVTNEDGTLFGMVSTGGIAESDMKAIEVPMLHEAPIFNVLSALEGHIINRDEDVFDAISGEVVIALPTPGGILRGVKEGAVVLCGQQEDVVEEALKLKASCIILCQSNLAEKYLGISSPTCMIATPYDAWRAARMLYQATPVGRIAKTDGLVCFHLDDFLDDVQETVLQSRYRSYPVLDRENNVIGTLGRYHLLKPQRKRIVLVDHNEVGQAVPGLDQAELVGIIDHHRLADVQTGYPVFMRNEPVGSTTTIVATMFQEHGLMPGEKLAGLMAAAIVSDTVMFKSPTTTPKDRRIAERLARIAGLDLDELGKEVFSASSADKSAEALLQTDFKEFHLGDHKLGISQITTMDSEHMIEREEEFLAEMDKLKTSRGYDMVLLMITDVLREGTELVFVGDKEILRQAFNVNNIEGNRLFLKGVVSRKKQMVPALSLLWG